MPPRLTAQDFDQELLILFDAYVHGRLAAGAARLAWERTVAFFKAHLR